MPIRDAGAAATRGVGLDRLVLGLHEQPLGGRSGADPGGSELGRLPAPDRAALAAPILATTRRQRLVPGGGAARLCRGDTRPGLVDRARALGLPRPRHLLPLVALAVGAARSACGRP